MAGSPRRSRILAAYSSGPALIPNTRGFRASLASPTSSPRVAQASAASVATPAELLTIPIRRPRWQRLALEEQGGVEQLLAAVEPQHSGLVQQRVDDCFAAQRRGRVGARFAARPFGPLDAP